MVCNSGPDPISGCHLSLFNRGELIKPTWNENASWSSGNPNLLRASRLSKDVKVPGGKATTIFLTGIGPLLLGRRLGVKA